MAKDDQNLAVMQAAQMLLGTANRADLVEDALEMALPPLLEAAGNAALLEAFRYELPELEALGDQIIKLENARLFNSQPCVWKIDEQIDNIARAIRISVIAFRKAAER